ncbi:integrase catalytic domain-containing protein [Trichonephila clavipes]|nr:integrase catalytic domain-containing protein [Trichonephila clavipes]
MFHSSNTAQNTAVRNANDQLLQFRFISGLRNDIRRFVLARDPNNLEESINAALIEEQNVKLNQIANVERTGLSPLQTETSVISALTNKLEEINLRVERLQEASSVTARKTGGCPFRRRESVFICFYCGVEGHRQAKPFLLGRKFKVFTDHKPLARFLSNKNPSSKILRWKLALEEFNYDIHYIRGSLNSVADHLSRCINNITIALPDSKDLIKMQHEDPVLSPIIQKIDQNDVSNYFIKGEGLLCHLSKRPSRSPRSNTTRKQVCIPHCLKARILESIHSEYGGHLIFFKTYHRLSENFFWQNMYKDTKNFVRSCTVCLSRKNAFKIPPAPHHSVEQSQEPGETCHIDIFGPLKTTPKEHGRDIRLSYTYEKNSDTPQNKYEYVEKLLPSLEQIFNKVLKNLKEQEASHVDLSTRATKQHYYDYKIGSLCFIKTPNIKSNLSPKLRPKFEGPDGRSPVPKVATVIFTSALLLFTTNGIW